MIPEFKSLNTQEIHLMLNTPALLTILIAGVDGKIDTKETDWAAKIAQVRSKDRKSVMQNYYEEVAGIFNETIEINLKELPQDADERAKIIISELKKIKDILPKLDKNFASEFYKGLKNFPTLVAKADGGLWGYGSISREEQKLIDLLNNEIFKEQKE